MKKYNKSLNYLQNAQERRERIERKEQNIFQSDSAFKYMKPDKIRMHYHRQEHKYAKEDIPNEKLKLKEELKEQLEPDILELKKKKWNASTSVPFNPESEETHDRKLWKIKLGLADGHNVKYKPPIIYTGTETRNIFGGWEQSTLVNYSRSNNYAMSSPAQLAQSVHLGSLKNESLLPYEYRSPQQRQVDYTNFIRDKKQNEQQIRQQLKEIYRYENPDCSIEKLNAGVHRLNYETKLKAGKLKQIKDDVNYTFSPNIEKTVKRNLVKKYSHTGQWTKFSKEKENGQIKDKWAYSCCLNEDINSQGCNQQIINKDKKILIGF